MSDMSWLTCHVWHVMSDMQEWAMLATSAQYNSRFGSLSKLYIDADPGAAHYWPISVHIRFGFKIYISIIKTLTRGAYFMGYPRGPVRYNKSLPYPNSLPPAGGQPMAILTASQGLAAHSKIYHFRLWTPSTLFCLGNYNKSTKLKFWPDSSQIDLITWMIQDIISVKTFFFCLSF
jgi:hypothetical protein